MSESTTREKEKLEEIIYLAMVCMHDMQGRLADDEHKRAFRCLESISNLAREGLGYA